MILARYFSMGLIAFLLFCFVISKAYTVGYGKAQAEGKVELEKVKRDYAEAATLRWAEYIAREQEAQVRYQEEQARADLLEAELLELKNNLVLERRGFAKRINDATFTNDCILTADIVRLYNEALYGTDSTPSAGGKNQASGTSISSQSSAAPAPIGTGVLREQPVTMKDLLAHAKLYGEWAREVYAIALSWNSLVPK